MFRQTSPSLSTLPIELVYRILDYLHPYHILISAYSVCGTLNSIIDTYQPSKVKLTFRIPRDSLVSVLIYTSFLFSCAMVNSVKTSGILIGCLRSNSFEVRTISHHKLYHFLNTFSTLPQQLHTIATAQCENLHDTLITITSTKRSASIQCHHPHRSL
jgi:hypothetical protein